MTPQERGVESPPYRALASLRPNGGHSLPSGHLDLAKGKPGKNAHRRKTEFLRDTAANKTGFLGVKWSERHQRFEAYIRDHRNGEGRKVYCGSAKTAEEAARAYDRKARELYGVRAVLNFPEAK